MKAQKVLSTPYVALVMERMMDRRTQTVEDHFDITLDKVIQDLAAIG